MNAQDPVNKYPWLAEPWAFFRRCLELDRLPHAMLLEGPAGCGKMALAQAMIAKLLCKEDQPVACGKCRSCELLVGGAHPELIDITFEINEKTGKLRSEIVIAQIRRTIEALQLTNTISSRKVACIHPADAMNKNSANALLKSLEEPAGADTVLVLVSDRPTRLPVTIRSRCQPISVRPPVPRDVREWLVSSSGRGEAEVTAAVEAAGGSPLRAEHFLSSPELEAYSQVRESLATLLGRPAAVTGVAARLAELDETNTWHWLSSNAGEAAKSVMQGRHPAWVPAGVQLNAKTLLQLEKQAGINRQLLATAVRNDLMLQAWLIKWVEQVV